MFTLIKTKIQAIKIEIKSIISFTTNPYLKEAVIHSTRYTTPGEIKGCIFSFIKY